MVWILVLASRKSSRDSSLRLPGVGGEDKNKYACNLSCLAVRKRQVGLEHTTSSPLTLGDDETEDDLNQVVRQPSQLSTRESAYIRRDIVCDEMHEARTRVRHSFPNHGPSSPLTLRHSTKQLCAAI